MLNNPKTRRILTYLMPILSLIVSITIVSHQYWRKETLKRQITQEESEQKDLISKLPKSVIQSAASKDGHDHHAHSD